MTGLSVAAEVANALREVATDVGTGEFSAFIIRTTGSPANPWETGGTVTTYELPCIDLGWRKITEEGTLIERMARVIMVSAEGLRPLVSDRVNVGDNEYGVIQVMPIATGGVDLYYKIALEGGTASEGVEGIAPPELIAPPEGQDW
jgi:hypothetical protein